MASMRSLMRPALSKSSSSAARIISSDSSDMNSSRCPSRNRTTLSTFERYSSGVTWPQHTPGPSPTCASKQGLSELDDDRNASRSPLSSLRLILRHSGHEAVQMGTTRLTASNTVRAALPSV